MIDLYLLYHSYQYYQNHFFINFNFQYILVLFAYFIIEQIKVNFTGNITTNVML